MRILQIAFHLSSGGAERFVVDLSNELSNHHEVILMTLKEDRSDPAFRFYLFALSKKVQYINLGLPSRKYLPSTMWKVYQAIKAIHPDVVHMHAAGMPKFCYLANLLLGNRMTFVQTIHNDLHQGYSTWLYDFVHATLGRSHRIRFAALSDTNFQELTRMYPHTLSTCIVNGRAPMVPTDLFEQVRREIESYKLNAQSKVILHIARCNQQKNQQLLIQAFNQLRAKNRNVILLMIGAGYEHTELGSMLRSMADPAVYFLGTRQNISDYMFCSDLFALSSSFEGMPITLLEALLSGTPVVSTPVCGAIDAINGRNGELSSDFSLPSYVHALEKVLDHLDTYQQHVMNDVPSSPYTIQACARKYLSFYGSPA